MKGVKLEACIHVKKEREGKVISSFWAYLSLHLDDLIYLLRHLDIISSFSFLEQPP
jgi:hypothetical protein